MARVRLETYNKEFVVDTSFAATGERERISTMPIIIM